MIGRELTPTSGLDLRDHALAHTPVGVTVAERAADGDLPIVYCNPGFERLTGYDASEVLGRNCRFLQRDDRHQDGLTLVRAAIADAAECHAVLRNYRKDGSLFWNELHLAPIRQPDDRGVTHFVGIQHDVTERVRLADELADKARELARSNAELERFAFAISHDLRGPVRRIAGLCDILRTDHADVLDDDGKQLLEHIVTNAGRIHDLVDDVLAHARAESGGRQAVEVDLASVLERVRSDVAELLAETSGELDVGPLPRVLGHRSLLEQLFTNLIENALKYRGTPPPRVWVKAARESGGWRIGVHDSGRGIPSDSLQSIFEPFRRIDDDDRGTGIGLATCKRIAERHGGRLWAESAGPGSGAGFFLYLPDDPGR